MKIIFFFISVTHTHELTERCVDVCVRMRPVPVFFWTKVWMLYLARAPSHSGTAGERETRLWSGFSC